MKIDHHIQESLIVRPQNSSPYPVFIQESFSPKGKIFLPERENEGSYFLIADSTLPTNILSPFLSDASHHFPKGKKDPHVIWFQGEEKNKNFHSMEPIYESLIQAGADRRSCLLALGGGVIGDLCGFVAASLFRGIDFIQIPTTLLAAVDASVGGKTGVNLRYGKNMIGSFHHPCLIYFNLSCLKSLPLRARIAGFAEMLKHSLLVSNPSVMDQLFCLSPQEDMRESNFQDLKLAIIHSIRIKSEIIAQDEKEKGLRAVLNLGHTTAHALESIYRQNTSDIDGMSHGEAVSRGLVTALLLSRRLKNLSPSYLERIFQKMNEWNLPCDTAGCSAEQVYRHTAYDKKNRRGNSHAKPAYVLLEAPGKPVTDQQIDRSDFHAVWMEQKSRFS